MAASPTSTLAADAGFADEVAGVVKTRLLDLAQELRSHNRSLADVGKPEDVASMMLTVVPAPSPWDDAVGPFYLGDQVRALLGGITRQALAERRSRLTLLALRTSDGEWVYPARQFDLAAGEVPDALAGVLQSFHTWDDDDWTIAAWLCRPLSELGGSSVLSWLLARSDASAAVAAARRQASRLGR